MKKYYSRERGLYSFVDDKQDIVIKEVKISFIIRFNRRHIPEQFDVIHFIEGYKPQILSEIDYEDDDERELLNHVFNSSKMRIPIFVS